jgi:endogenous inhibitor of DNA gyrase (YacG/DUF329 family)
MLKEVRCPACRRLTPWDGNVFRPFCSERCKLHDFGNWAAERYRIPDSPLEDTSGNDEDEGGPELH